MRLAACVTAVALAWLVSSGVPEAHSKPRTLDVDCSVTGDLCVFAVREGGRIKLTVRSFVDVSGYTLCVRRRGESRVCKSFDQRLTRGGIYQSRVDWRRQFGFSRGRHRATWTAPGGSAPFGSVRFKVGGGNRSTPERVRKCGGIAFTPRSEDGVYRIRARGVSCRRARRVARAVEPLGIVEGPYEYSEAGFECRGRPGDSALPTVRYRCAHGRDWISFSRA